MLDFLQGVSDVAIIIRLLIATLLGSIIGLERIAGRHNAGVRTFALVCLGAAASAALNVKLALLPGLNVDGSRISAGVISGIGFLGAGTILVTGRSQIKGLTTAATLWVASALGLVIGSGYLVIGIACFVLVLVANRLMQHISQNVEEHNRRISIYLEVDKVKGVTKLRQYFAEAGYDVVSMNKSKEKTLLSADVGLMVVLDLKKKMAHQEVLTELSRLNCVNYLEEI